MEATEDSQRLLKIPHLISKVIRRNIFRNSSCATKKYEEREGGVFISIGDGACGHLSKVVAINCVLILCIRARVIWANVKVTPISWFQSFIHARFAYHSILHSGLSSAPKPVRSNFDLSYLIVCFYSAQTNAGACWLPVYNVEAALLNSKPNSLNSHLKYLPNHHHHHYISLILPGVKCT